MTGRIEIKIGHEAKEDGQETKPKNQMIPDPHTEGKLEARHVALAEDALKCLESDDVEGAKSYIQQLLKGERLEMNDSRKKSFREKVSETFKRYEN